MEVDVQVTPATMDDVRELAPIVRDSDRDEIWATSRRCPEAALTTCLKMSDTAWAARMNGDLICMFGVASLSLITKTGTPWMISSDHLTKYSFAFLGHCRQYIAEMLEDYPVLVNHVDARNTASKLWLRWVGFDVQPYPEPYGVLEKPFHKFEMRA